ncbi:MAG: hypothetical protein IPQ09_02670 [Myxococcales bacterium]|jgi:hypothetical protein|nr:hypothetical protein [Myxococcales bacterium]HQY64845.1 hypothetical protein [Polyangiaceae bacterium]
MENRFFFPQQALDEWIVDGRIELANGELTIVSEGRVYRVAEAVRVLVEVTGAEDENELVGRVKSLAFLQELGAELLEGSMLIGDNAYDVVPGFTAVPPVPYEEHRKRRSGATAGSDEALIQSLAVGSPRA